MATCIATVFASLTIIEFPLVRYRAAKSLDAMAITTLRDLVPTKLAGGVWNCLMKYKQTIENFPVSKTCELLILKWTYDAICHDLVNLEGNKYVNEVPSKTGGPPEGEKKEFLLEEHHPIWVELLFALIAYTFVAHDSALHQKINRIIRETGLRELGQLEQDLVFCDAEFKDVIKVLTAKEDVTLDNKLRLLMIAASIYPEKFEGEKGLNLMKLAKLTADDMTAVNNMRLFGGSSEKKKSRRGKKRTARKDRSGGEEISLLKNLVKTNCQRMIIHVYMNDPSPTFHGTAHFAVINEAPVAHSMRSRRTRTWARPRSSDDGCSSDSVLKHALSGFEKIGQCIFEFVVGGATSSELRICYKLTTELNGEVMLTAHELSLDDIQI
ncbi:SNARE-interacting protein KEULE [Citrus sinensis]|uniref:SNARE-interacting protein KEULE n=1 Tax=Citrus sinensis TaxID=2711 RepID=A0ACB8NUY0_CITSI|nr:SNARE-interacting protein KEULE [Citrus sinensis]